MVKDVEELGPELGGEPFPELPTLDQGQIPVAQARVAPAVTARCAEGSEGGGNQHGAALGIAAVRVERGYRRGVKSARRLETRSRGSCGLSPGQRHRTCWGKLGARNGARRAEVRASAIRNGGVTRLKVLVVAEKIPAIGTLKGPADIVRLIVPVPGLAGLQRYDGIELPTFQKLSWRFLPW